MQATLINGPGDGGVIEGISSCCGQIDIQVRPGVVARYLRRGMHPELFQVGEFVVGIAVDDGSFCFEGYEQTDEKGN